MEYRKMVLMNLFAGQQWRCRHREQTCGHREQRRRGWNEWRQYHGNMYTTICKIASGNLLYDSGNSDPGSVMGWEVGGRFQGEGTKMYTYGLIHIDVWQKPTQYCKAIILQLKINKLKNKNKTKNIMFGMFKSHSKVKFEKLSDCCSKTWTLNLNLILIGPISSWL